MSEVTVIVIQHKTQSLLVQRYLKVKRLIIKKQKTFSVFPQSYRNTSGSLREREIAVLNYVIQIWVSIEVQKHEWKFDRKRNCGVKLSYLNLLCFHRVIETLEEVLLQLEIAVLNYVIQICCVSIQLQKHEWKFERTRN